MSVIFAGLAPFVFYYGITGVVIALAVAFYFFAPIPWGFKKAALWVAAVAAYTMFAITIGVKIEHNRNAAREAAVVAREEKVSARERDAVDAGIKPEPRSLRGPCLQRKAAHDRC